MIEKAKNKIIEEMNKNKDDDYVQVVGDFLINQIEINEDAARIIATGGKNIKDSLKYMENEAKNRANGRRCVCINPVEGFKIIMKYFGFEGIQSNIENFAIQEMKHEEKQEEEFNVDLNDFI